MEGSKWRVFESLCRAAAILVVADADRSQTVLEPFALWHPCHFRRISCILKIVRLLCSFLPTNPSCRTDQKKIG
jgi:hypothetical protein